VTGTYKKYEIWRRGVVIRELEEVGCDRNLPNMKYGEGTLSSESWKK
jgi:hypothetical protein